MQQLNFSDAAQPTSISVQTDAPAAGTSESITVASTANYPAAPFLLGLDRGTPAEEVALCTSVTDGTHFVVTRGYDGRAPQVHNVNGVVEHVAAAVIYTQANQLSIIIAKGDLLGFDGTSFHRVPVGADGQILVADSGQTSGLNWWTAPPSIYNQAMMSVMTAVG